MNWRIGQEVICIDDSFFGITNPPIKKGKIYIIKGIRKRCCGVVLDVGAIDPQEYPDSKAICHECGITVNMANKNNAWEFKESRFAPLEYDQQAIEELLENTLVKTQ